MNEPEILSRFEQVRRVGDEWTARCPAHEDRKPSLSIREEGGKVLLHCHAGCSVQHVLEAAGLKMADLFDDALQPQLVATYPYCDEQGSLLHQVVRYEPKDFKQRRPDGKGGWIWNLKGVRRVLYRLPDVLKAKSVVIAEGEKDCETARAMNLVATCNPSGAGKWCEEYSECLRDKRIAVIADADEPGRKHAEHVAQSLRGKAESAKVLELPDAKDLTAWVEKGGTRERLLELIRNAPKWKDAGNKSGCHVAKIAAWDDIPGVAALPNGSVEWLAKGLIPRAGVVLLAGESGAMKTWLALVLARAVASGSLFLGRECRLSDVLYLDRENPAAVVRERCELLGMMELETLRYWGGWMEEAPPGIGDARLGLISRERRPLVVFDSFIRFSGAADENSASEIAQAMGELRALAYAGATVLVIHHKPKSQASWYRGSSDILAGVDVGYGLSKDADCGLLRLECFKSRYGDEPKLTLRANLDERGDFEVTDPPSAVRESEEVEKIRSFIEANPGLAKRDVAASCGVPKGRALKLLGREAGRHWRIEPGERNAQKFYPLDATAEVEIPL